MAGFRAVLDACVLVPIVKTDLLLQFASQGAYHPLWSSRILDEVVQAIPRVTKNRVSTDKAMNRTRYMNEAFRDALVEYWEPLEPQILGLPDPKDRHVVAAAIRGHASVIVTDNLRDFPATSLSPWGLHAVSSNDFLLDLYDLDRQRGLGCLHSLRRRYRNPPVDLNGLLKELSRAGLGEFVSEVRKDVK